MPGKTGYIKYGDERIKVAMKLIIQIPCFNEEKTLAETVADLPRHIDGIDVIEYLIINDGSKDRTVEVARECGVHYAVQFKKNKGLAKGFMAGLDACLRLGADIIVNTDADNQYKGSDIEKLVRPILDGTADCVIGSRPIEDIEHFSARKKRLQRLGSSVVRYFSGTEVEDAPSGFRAYSRAAAMKLNVMNNYTYTMETLIQTGQAKLAIACVPIGTNPETRKSRLFKSMFSYIRRSGITILRSFMMYKPMKFFFALGSVLILVGVVIDIRFLVYYFMNESAGHIQSLILSVLLLLVGFILIVAALLSELISTNRRLLEEIQTRVRSMDYRMQRMPEDEINRIEKLSDSDGAAR